MRALWAPSRDMQQQPPELPPPVDSLNRLKNGYLFSRSPSPQLQQRKFSNLEGATKRRHSAVTMVHTQPSASLQKEASPTPSPPGVKGRQSSNSSTWPSRPGTSCDCKPGGLDRPSSHPQRPISAKPNQKSEDGSTQSTNTVRGVVVNNNYEVIVSGAQDSYLLDAKQSNGRRDWLILNAKSDFPRIGLGKRAAVAPRTETDPTGKKLSLSEALSGGKTWVHRRYSIREVPSYSRTEVQRETNLQLSRKLKAFDRRYLNQESDSGSNDEDEDADARDTFTDVPSTASSFKRQISPSLSGLGHGLRERFLRSGRRSSTPSRSFRIEDAPRDDKKSSLEVRETSPDVIRQLEEDEQEIELHFKVIKWSSQRPESPATDLAENMGSWWESAPMHIEHEFIVLQLEGDGRVDFLDFILPGNECGPRFCHLKYSTSSADGPWHNAWSFNTPSKEETRFRTSFKTGWHPTKEFKDWLQKYPGGLDEAWCRLMDHRGAGMLSYPDFKHAVLRCKLHISSSSNANIPAWCNEAQKIFEDLDPLCSGFVTMASISNFSGNPPPKALWWRLTIVNNWGSNKRVQVLSPLQIYTLQKVEVGGFSNIRRRIHDDTVRCGPTGNKLVMAFDVRTLGLDSATVFLRRLAKKYRIPLLDMEDTFKLFSASSSDGLNVEREEFTKLIMKMYGTQDISDIPPQRLRGFWSQADKNADGSIDFEEFIIWYDLYGDEIKNRRRKTGGNWHS